MNLAWLITSSIDVTSSPLTYSPIRSIFNSSERLSQTKITIESINQFCDQDFKIFLLDTSDNWQLYKDYFSYQSNLQFVSVKEEFPEIHHEVTNHANKSRCESSITQNFLLKYKDQIKEFDSVIKISGRYFIDDTFDSSKLDHDKIYFKRPLEYDWQDWWQYDMVKLKDYNKLFQYCSTLFAWGKNHFDNVVDIYTIISNLLAQPDMQHYDIETLLYFLTRPLKDEITETNWNVFGWLAPNGQFIRY